MSISIIIFKNGRRSALDLNEGDTISWEWINPLFITDLSEDSFSLPLEIPFTQNNRNQLGAPEMLEAQGLDANIYWEAEVLEDGIPILSNVKLSLINIESSFDYLNGSYSVSLSGPASLFGARIKSKLLNQLPLYQLIKFDVPSREFAYQVMVLPSGAHKAAISFAPVHRNGYFDEGRNDYDNESMYSNVANRIHRMPSTGLWFYAPPTATPGSDSPAAAGTERYSEHRTIPFFRLTFVLKQLFSHFGYQLKGTFFNIPDIESIHIDNNFAIEVYQQKVLDLNRKIDIRDHLPAISVAEFLSALCKAMNLYLVFDKLSNIVNLDVKAAPSIISAVDITAHLVNNFESEPFDELQYKINFEFDTSDDMVSSLVKDSINARASFNTLGQVSNATFSPALADGDIIYIIAENLYYSWSIQFSKWLYYAEGQQGRENKSEEKYEVPLSPLLRWLEVSENGVNVDNGMCSSSGAGSYVGFKSARIKKEFPLRLLMIKGKQEAGYAQPIPYTTNISDKLCLSYSMVGKGLYDQCFKAFHKAFADTNMIKCSLASERLDIEQLETRAVAIKGVPFVVKKINNEIGLKGVAELELVKF